MDLWSKDMKPVIKRRDHEDWTGELDLAPAIALIASLAFAALIFLVMGAAELHR
jgi:hypothetical protein